MATSNYKSKLAELRKNSSRNLEICVVLLTTSALGCVIVYVQHKPLGIAFPVIGFVGVTLEKNIKWKGFLRIAGLVFYFALAYAGSFYLKSLIPGIVFLAICIGMLLTS